VDCIDSTVLVMAVRPLSAASRVLMPFDIASSSAPMSEARPCSEAEVKKLVGLSRAELTFLPVARRF
jgi:hypothetical protein